MAAPDPIHPIHPIHPNSNAIGASDAISEIRHEYFTRAALGLGRAALGTNRAALGMSRAAFRSNPSRLPIEI